MTMVLKRQVEEKRNSKFIWRLSHLGRYFH